MKEERRGAERRERREFKMDTLSYKDCMYYIFKLELIGYIYESQKITIDC